MVLNHGEIRFNGKSSIFPQTTLPRKLEIFRFTAVPQIGADSDLAVVKFGN